MEFADSSVEEALGLLQSEIGRLSRRQFAGLFGIIGETLLPLYESFSSTYRWGDPSILRRAVTASLGFATSGLELQGVGQISESISEVIPDEQSFDAPVSTFAMDAAICVDAGLRAGDRSEEIDASWIEYALQPIISTICEEQTGYLDLGSTEKGKRWNKEAMKIPRIKDAFSSIALMIETLKSTNDAIELADLDRLRLFAKALLI